MNQPDSSGAGVGSARVEGSSQFAAQGPLGRLVAGFSRFSRRDKSAKVTHQVSAGVPQGHAGRVAVRLRSL